MEQKKKLNKTAHKHTKTDLTLRLKLQFNLLVIIQLSHLNSSVYCFCRVGVWATANAHLIIQSNDAFYSVQMAVYIWNNYTHTQRGSERRKKLMQK